MTPLTKLHKKRPLLSPPTPPIKLHKKRPKLEQPEELLKINADLKFELSSKSIIIANQQSHIEKLNNTIVDLKKQIRKLQNPDGKCNSIVEYKIPLDEKNSVKN